MGKNFNHVALEGNLTRDPELSYLPNTDTALAKFSIACNDIRKKNGNYEDEVSYFDILVFGKTGENCGKYLNRGSKVLVSGRLKQERFQDKQGQNRTLVKVVASEVHFLSTPNRDNQPQQNNGFQNQGNQSGFGQNYNQEIPDQVQNSGYGM